MRRIVVLCLCAAVFAAGAADPAFAKKRKKRVGSSTPPGIVNLAPIRPNAPIGPDLTVPRASPEMPRALVAPQPQPPFVGPTGAYPVPDRRPGETFQDRAARCQFNATTSGVPNASRGAYINNCAM